MPIAVTRYAGPRDPPRVDLRPAIIGKLVYGHPLALVLMVISAIVPIYWFKRNGWL